MQKLSIIDTIGPFFLNTDGSTVNWSKIPFSTLEKKGRLAPATQQEIITRFEAYVKKVSALGYTSISIDDLAHLTPLPFYSSSLQELLSDWHKLYKKLFLTTKKQGMGIYINTDYLFFNKEIERYLKTANTAPEDFFLEVLEATFKNFPEISGIVLRIGENDGKDVADHFLSKLLLKKPHEVTSLLQKILPLFERYDKALIFRTWTVGVYEIGDLIWNTDTFDAIFSSIKSDALIISMKFSDTDFMRYLHLNPLFFHSHHKKIIELQTRREWEGMGELVSFVGWDYEKYLLALSKNDSLVGIHVWCQTGGWAKWNNLTYLRHSSFWNELNTEVVIDLQHGKTTEQAIEAFCKKRGIRDSTSFTKLLKRAEATVKKGLYISEIAKQKFYFRRTRIPTLLWIEWDKMPLQPLFISLLRQLVKYPHRAIAEADKATLSANEMLTIGQELALDSTIIESLEFQRATFSLFAQLRRYIFTDVSSNEIDLLNKKIATYQKQYPQHYKISNLKVYEAKKIPHQLLALLRTHASYRKRDKLLLASSRPQRWLVRYYLRRSNSHLADQSMGIEALFK